MKPLTLLQAVFSLGVALAGCQQPASNTCDDGSICPVDTRCGQIEDKTICVAPTCGNSRLESGEACDDGNNVSSDGCPADCTAPCGDGLLDPNEACDDGNALDGDGCDHNCTPTACGNGVATSGEACDDGNAADGDGCDRNCTATACGNGVGTSGEACDDGNATNDDGCDRGCVMSCLLEAPTFAFIPSSALTIIPGIPSLIDIAFTNRNSPNCASVSFAVLGTLLVDAKQGALQLAPFSTLGIATSLIPSGTTGHMTVSVNLVSAVPPGTVFVVSFVITGVSKGAYGGLAAAQITITVGS